MSSLHCRVLAAACCALLLGACSSSDRDLPTLTITEQPSVSPVEAVPLAWSLTLATSINTLVEAELEDNLGNAFRINFSSFGREHDVTLLNLRPERTYTVRVTAFTRDGITQTAEVTPQFSTPPLPADFPALSVLTSEPDRMEPGYTLFDAVRKDRSAGYIVIVDAAGEVVWYLAPEVESVTRRVANGALLTLDAGIGLIREIDERGRSRVSFHSAQTAQPVGNSIAVDVAEFHDDVVKIEGVASYLTGIVDTSRKVDDFPVNETDPTITGRRRVRDEPIVEFNALGTVGGELKFLDLLKPTRIGYDGTSGLPEAADWAHLTSVFLDRADNTIVAALRHQDAVVKVSAGTRELQWIIAPPANWEGFEEFLLTPDGADFAWPYHPHGAQITPAGTVLLFDNGNRRASPFTGEPIVPADANQSRAVEYSVNVLDRTVTQVWQWGLAESGEAFYAPFAGDADRLSGTGNTLITFGGLCAVGGVPSDDLAACRASARIIEVEAETDERVFDLAVDDADAGSSGYTVAQSERLRTLYGDPSIVITVLE